MDSIIGEQHGYSLITLAEVASRSSTIVDIPQRPLVELESDQT